MPVRGRKCHGGMERRFMSIFTDRHEQLALRGAFFLRCSALPACTPAPASTQLRQSPKPGVPKTGVHLVWPSCH